MLQSSEGLWALFVAAALGLTIPVAGLGAAIGIAQHRVLRLHRDYGRQLLTTQDEERAWVAREVHDDAVQRLAVLRHELTLWDKELAALPLDHRRRLAGIQAEIEDLSVALRQLAHRLHPASLDHGHLGFALEQLAEEAGRVLGLSVELALPEGLDVRTSNRVLALYRIAQEALRNVARHAGVERASMTVTLDQRKSDAGHSR